MSRPWLQSHVKKEDDSSEQGPEGLASQVPAGQFHDASESIPDISGQAASTHPEPDVTMATLSQRIQLLEEGGSLEAGMLDGAENGLAAGIP